MDTTVLGIVSGNHQESTGRTVDFGHQRVGEREKTERVQEVFHRVAQQYDVMNDVISLGTHRLFKRAAVELTGLQSGHRVLDLAGGTGDISKLLAPVVGDSGHVVLADPNLGMVQVGRDRLLDDGMGAVNFCLNTAEALPFADGIFHAVIVSFGLRNFTSKMRALEEAHRVLKPGGRLVVLEFSKPKDPLMASLYKGFQALWPTIGSAVVGDGAPYRYLVESIDMHPAQAALAQMLRDANFADVTYHDLLGGVAAIHVGGKR